MTGFLRIDLSDFDNRKEEIAKDLMKAASEHGFFYGNNFCLVQKKKKNFKSKQFKRHKKTKKYTIQKKSVISQSY